MNKIKQNKITFTLILVALAIIFSSLTILSLPVLFNYESKVALIEKNFYKNFKIFLNSSGKISYKPFPKPHLLVENASLNLLKSNRKTELVNTTNLKIYISLRDLYLRSFNRIVSASISNSNLEIQISDLDEVRRHLYYNINKPITFNDCKIFLRNKKNEVILISPVKKISYKINDKNKIKNLTINGNIFGLNYKSEWKRKYDTPKLSFHIINIFNPKIEFKNKFESIDRKKFNIHSNIAYLQDKMEYNIQFQNGIIDISSPNKNKTNFNIKSRIQLNPFYFNGSLIIKNKKIDNLIDNILFNLMAYNEDYLGNFNGELNIKFEELNNKLIKKGEINFNIIEKKTDLEKARFVLDKIGFIKSNLSFEADNGLIKFISKNELNIENYIEFAKVFQISTKKIKNINKIYFDLERNIGQKDFILSNIKINNIENTEKSNEVFLVKNIQNLRSHIRKVID
tara:strand:- start:135 stop:1502 length:1368 start_codon:yes stop_codon:yes gene_type:complete